MGSRQYIIRVVGPIIFFIFYVYLCHQLFRLSDLPWIVVIPLMLWVLLVICLVLVVPLYLWTLPDRGQTKFQITAVKTTYFAQGYLNYLLLLVVGRDVLGFVGTIFKQWWVVYNGEEALIILLLPLLLIFLGRMIVCAGPFVLKTKIAFENLPADLQNLRIAQLSDLHIGPGITLRKMKKIIKKTNQILPDLIVLTGDIIDYPEVWYVNEINELANLKAKYGVYYIPGNHEYYWGYEPIVNIFKRLGIVALLNEHKKIQIGKSTLAVCGLTDLAAKYFAKEEPDLAKAIAGTENCDFRLLLAHQPELADRAKEYQFDLQLSGHTHAGQMIPWSLMIRLFQKYPKGHYNLGRLQLYVNQGTGTWGPPERLGTVSEISEISLIKKV